MFHFPAGEFILFYTMIPGILEMDAVSFGAPSLPRGRPGASTLAPWGTMGRSRDTREHRDGDLWAQASIFKFWLDLIKIHD